MTATVRDFYDFVKTNFPNYLSAETSDLFIVLEENVVEVYEASFDDTVEFSLLVTTESGGSFDVRGELEIDVIVRPENRPSFTLFSVWGSRSTDFLQAWLNR